MSAASSRPARHTPAAPPLRTPDGRYIVVRGRLWRATNPAIPPEQHERLVQALMTARRAVAAALTTHDVPGLQQARAEVDLAKRGLGERGPVWWTDGSPDLNRHMVRNSPYADWFDSVGGHAPA